MLPFGEFRPDVADLDTQFAREARNVAPKANSYGPMPGLSPYTSNALAATCLGLTLARTETGTWSIFSGTATELYKFSSGSWTDVSRSSGGDYAVAAGDFWKFVEFGDTLIATNYTDDVQSIDITSGSNFAALSGSPPKARGVSVVGDFVVLWGLASDNSAIHWSAINDPTGWTVGTDLSDTQTFPDHGKVTGVVHAIDGGYVLQEYAIRTMRFLPGNPDNAFEFDQVIEGKGCISPYGWASQGDTVYFLSEDGFYSFGPAGLKPIGAQRVNQWFLDRADLTVAGQVLAVSDPYRPRILWAFRTPASSVFNRLLIYDWQLDRWSYAIVSAQMWSSAATPGTDLDSISTALEDLPYSLDSRVWEGGRPTIVAVDTNSYLGFMEGANLEALIETPEVHPFPGQRAFVESLYPIVDTDDATFRIGYRERLQDQATYTSSGTIVDTGEVPLRASGRLMRVEMTVPAGTAWTHAQGVQPNAQPDGVR